MCVQVPGSPAEGRCISSTKRAQQARLHSSSCARRRRQQRRHICTQGRQPQQVQQQVATAAASSSGVQQALHKPVWVPQLHLHKLRRAAAADQPAAAAHRHQHPAAAPRQLAGTAVTGQGLQPAGQCPAAGFSMHSALPAADAPASPSLFLLPVPRQWLPCLRLVLFRICSSPLTSHWS